LDPGDEVGDLLPGEAVAFGGHEEVGIVASEGVEEEGFFGVTGGDGGLFGSAAAEEAGAGIYEQISFELLALRAVALVALVDEDGADFLFEEVEVFVGCADVGGAGALGGGEGDGGPCKIQ
jgi:hypothetical protein